MRGNWRGVSGAKRCSAAVGRFRAGAFSLPSSGCLALALLACAATAALAQGDWLPQLEPAPGEYRGRNDPIVIALPAGLDPTVYENLAVELDDFDLTAFVTLEGDRLVLLPPEALSSGRHSLRLVERAGDGSILERGYWNLDVRHSALVRDLAANADLSGAITGRIAENGLDTPPQHVTGDSGGNVEASAGDENWRISGNANYFYNTQLDLTPDGRNFDIGEYRIDGDFEDENFFAGLTVGDQDTGIQNFVMSDFYRRGISFRAGLPDDLLSVTGFVQSTEALIGTRHVLGISHEEDRVEGVSVTTRPIPGLKDNIELSGTFYTGEGKDSGYGIGGEDSIVNDGTGWSVAADTLWLDEAFRLRGEYSQAEFDFDGKDVGFSAETSDAYSVLTSLEPLRGATLDGSTFTWTIGAQYENIDTFYHSLANPTLQADRATASVFTDFYWDEFTAQLRVDHQTSNVDDLNYLPTDRNINVFFNGTYSPFVEPLEDGSMPWYGQPYFGVQAALYEIDRIEHSEDFPGDDADNTTRSLTFSAGSNYQTWSWNFSHTIYSFEDHVDLSSDFLNNITAISGYFLVDDWLTLSPSLQWDMFDDLDEHEGRQTLNAGLGVEVTVIPDRLTTSVNYIGNFQFGNGDTPDTNSLNGEVVLTLLKADVNRPGVALALTGFIQDTNDDHDNPSKDLQYQAFTALRLSLPVAY